jgi:PEP-CTERM motif-containing protein
MFSKIAKFVLISLTVLASATVAKADTFHYDYSFVEPFIGVYSFTFDSPSLITSDEPSLTPSSCTALGSPCNQIGILAASGEIRIYGENSLSAPGLPASFFEVGSHTFDSSSMTITDEVSTSPVPEPSSLALLTAGILAGASRLRKFKATLNA